MSDQAVTETMKAISAPMQAERVSGRELAAHGEAITALAANAAEPNPFFEPWSLFPAIDLLKEAQGFDYLLFHDADGLAGFLPLEKASGYAHLPVPYYRTGLHRHCFLGAPLVRTGREEAFFEALMAAPAALGLRGSFLQLRHMIADGPLERAMLSVCGAHAYAGAEWQRAALASELTYEGYLLANIRGKKRKEWRRLTNRLSEEGEVSFHLLEEASELAQWTDEFLRLEHEGWRGHGGSSLMAEETGAEYLKAILEGAFACGQLTFLRLDVGEKCLAMLINFTAGGKAWSFKIAHDPAYARYSPGVMIELELTRLALDEKRFAHIDSCAQEDHPMIDKIWAERQAMRHWNMPLPGMANRAILSLCRMLETTSERTREMLGTKGVSA